MDRLILGIHVAHDASVALTRGNEVLFALQEDRLTRIKHHYGFPSQALRELFRQTGVSADELDAVAFPSSRPMYPKAGAFISIALDGTARTSDEFGELRMDEIEASNLLTVEQWKELGPRHFLNFQGELIDGGILRPGREVYYVHHHRAHAASAVATSGFSECAIVTADGKGDKAAATVFDYSISQGLRLVRETSDKNSLGAFYQAATEALGFLPVDGEYKTMGLAALVSHRPWSNPFEDYVRVEDGRLISAIPWRWRSLNDAGKFKNLQNPLSGIAQTEPFAEQLALMPRDRFAHFVQDVFERRLSELACQAVELTGRSRLAAAGGLFLNVKANSVIERQLGARNVYVYPDAADSGLAAGAAMAAAMQGTAPPHPVRLATPYLGHSVGERESQLALERCRQRHQLQVMQGDPATVAAQIAYGDVVGTFQGRQEMGPRALGNRSVLADPRFRATKTRINDILKGREWFVPFAPVLLRGEAEKYWSGHHDYKYMVSSVLANARAKEEIPAVVHFDGTMRPQVVVKDDNPWLYELLHEFKAITGVGVLLNTSFNRHGLPIVGSVHDCIDHLVNGWVDGLSLGRWYVCRQGSGGSG